MLSALAMIALNRLAYDEARALGEDALKIARETGDRRGAATALRILGMIAREQGQYERALGLLEESMALGRALGDAAWTARVASQMGITHRLAGNAEQAQHFLDASRELHTELGDRFALAVIASNSGHLAFDAGDVTRAVALYAEALRYFDSVGDPEGFVEAIEWLAVAAAARGEAVPALRLFGAAAAAREALHLPPRFESDEKRFASGLDQAMRAAGTERTVALAAGRTLSLERARDEALELARSRRWVQTNVDLMTACSALAVRRRVEKGPGRCLVHLFRDRIPIRWPQDGRHCERLAEAADLDERLGREGEGAERLVTLNVACSSRSHARRPGAAPGCQMVLTSPLPSTSATARNSDGASAARVLGTAARRPPRWTAP